MARTNRIGTHATSVLFDSAGVTQVIYHNTPVVAFDAERITLRKDGFQTVTTKLRMNQASNQFHLGYQVYQKDFAWYVRFRGADLPFWGDEIVLIRTGERIFGGYENHVQ